MINAKEQTGDHDRSTGAHIIPESQIDQPAEHDLLRKWCYDSHAHDQEKHALAIRQLAHRLLIFLCIEKGTYHIDEHICKLCKTSSHDQDQSAFANA